MTSLNEIIEYFKTQKGQIATLALVLILIGLGPQLGAGTIGAIIYARLMLGE